MSPQHTMLSVLGALLALVLATTVFVVVLNTLGTRLSNLQAFATEVGQRIYPDAPSVTTNDPLVPRKKDQSTDRIVVPSVIGVDISSALAMIEAAGLLPQTERGFHPIVEAGTVVQQTPVGGTRAQDLAPVIITVSQGSPLAAIPNVVGLRSGSARTRLTTLGFQVIEIVEFNDDVEAGTVLRQDPLAGAMADRRSVVALHISHGMELLPVPAVVGQSEGIAHHAIELAGLDIGTITYREYGTVPNGIVEAQSPPTGTLVPRGYPVEITVVRIGETVIPAVLGLAPDAAERELANHDLLVGSISHLPVADVTSHQVIGQEPGVGAKVARGFAVRLIIAVPKQTDVTTTKTKPSKEPTASG